MRRCALSGRSPAARACALGHRPRARAAGVGSPIRTPPRSSRPRGRVGRHGARAAGDHPRRCGPRRRARGHRLAHHQRPGEGCTGDTRCGSRRRSASSASSPTGPRAVSSPGGPATSPSSFPTSRIRISHRWCAPWSVRPGRTISRSSWSIPVSIPTRRCGPQSRCPGRSTDSSWCRRGACTVRSARWVPLPPSSSTVPSPNMRPSFSRTAPAVTDALAHLSGLGHTRLAYLGGPAGSWAAGSVRAR